MTSSNNAWPRISTHLGYFSPSGDRYNPAGYRDDIPVKERISLASQVEGLDGVELHFPGMVQVDTAGEMKAFLDEKGLRCPILSVSVWGHRKWGLGSLTCPDPSVRRDAVETIAQGMGVSKTVGANMINLWLGQDGFDYPFQSDYGKAVEWLIEGLRECAVYDPQVKICLEPKLKEPRTHLAVESTAKVLWLADKVGTPNLGALLDVGHAFQSYESPAQSAVLLQREGRLFHLHFSDNYGDWDWDMIPGTVRFWEHIELMFWLRESGYTGWHSIDITMPRGDPLLACRQSVNNLRRLWKQMLRLDHDQIMANLARPDHPYNLQAVADTVFQGL